MLDEHKIREMAKELFMIWHEIRMELDKAEIKREIGCKNASDVAFFDAYEWPLGNGMYAPALVCVCKDGRIKDPWKELGGDEIIERIEAKKHIRLDYKDCIEEEWERAFAAVFRRIGG
jgi:hypothetical protein